MSQGYFELLVLRIFDDCAVTASNISSFRRQLAKLNLSSLCLSIASASIFNCVYFALIVFIFYGKQLCNLAVAIKVIFLIVNETLYIYGVSENSTYTLNFIVAILAVK